MGIEECIKVEKGITCKTQEDIKGEYILYLNKEYEDSFNTFKKFFINFGKERYGSLNGGVEWNAISLSIGGGEWILINLGQEDGKVSIISSLEKGQEYKNEALDYLAKKLNIEIKEK